MANCLRCSVTNPSTNIKSAVIFYRRCSDNLTIDEYTIKPGETIKIWAIENTLKSALLPFIDIQCEIFPLTPTPQITPSVTTTPFESPTPTISETPTQTPTPTISETPTSTPTITPTNTPTNACSVCTEYNLFNTTGTFYTVTWEVQFCSGGTGNVDVNSYSSVDVCLTQPPTLIVGDPQWAIASIIGCCDNITPTPTETPTSTPTPTISETPTLTPTPTITESLTPSVTPTDTLTPTPTPTISETPTLTPTPTISESATSTPTPTVTDTPTQTPSVTPTTDPTQTPTQSVTPTITPTISETPTQTPTPSISETPTLTPTPTVTDTLTPTPTPSISETPTLTPTPTISETPTLTPTPTISDTPTLTPTPTISETPTLTPTPTISETPTLTPTPTISETPTNTPTPTVTDEPTATPTATVTPTITPSPTNAIVASCINVFSYRNYGGGFTVNDPGYMQLPSTQPMSAATSNMRFNNIDQNVYNISGVMSTMGVGDTVLVEATGSFTGSYILFELGESPVLTGDNWYFGNFTVLNTNVANTGPFSFDPADVTFTINSLCPSPTPTETPTNTPTPTVSETPTNTPTNTPTPTVTDTPTSTPTPTNTPTSVLSTGFTVTVTEVGSDVVWYGSGSLNLSDLSIDSTVDIGAGFNSVDAVWAIGPTEPVQVEIYGGPSFTTYPSSFGTGGEPANTGEGSTVGVIAGGASSRVVIVPQDYISGTYITGSTTYNNTTISGLNLIEGTYTYTWGTGPNESSIYLIIGSGIPTPTPTSSPTSTLTPTPTISVTPTSSVTPTPTITPTITKTPTSSPSPTYYSIGLMASGFSNRTDYDQPSNTTRLSQICNGVRTLGAGVVPGQNGHVYSLVDCSIITNSVTAPGNVLYELQDGFYNPLTGGQSVTNGCQGWLLDVNGVVLSTYPSFCSGGSSGCVQCGS